MKGPNVNKIVATIRARIDTAILTRLQLIGEEFVKNARTNGSYTDRSSNLRSSIGYVVLLDGQEQFESFPGNTEEGKKAGRSVASEVSSEFPRGWILVCVAGMQYASLVEARGFSVITNSALIAKEQFQKDIKQLIENLKS